MSNPSLSSSYRSSSILCVCLWSSGCSISGAQDSFVSQLDPSLSWQEKVAAVSEHEIEQTGVPSIQIAVSYQGRIVYSDAHGHADIQGEWPATIDSQYRTASISKWLTGTATLKLAEDGLLNLDAPVQNYCPDFPIKAHTVTSRRLLTHTAGFRHTLDYDQLRARAESEEERVTIEARIALDQSANTTRYTDRIQPLETFKDEPLAYEPGRAHYYSSLGYRVLGCVIRGAAGQSYNDTMRDLIFNPSGMTKTVPDDLANPPADRVVLYSLVDNGQRRPARMRDVSSNLPAGGHLSTAEDLIRFTLAFADGKLLSDESIELMKSEPIDLYGKPMKVGYGHGTDFLSDFPNSIGHYGRQAGTSTLLVYLPDYDASIAVMGNADNWRTIIPFTGRVLSILKRHEDEL